MLNQFDPIDTVRFLMGNKLIPPAICSYWIFPGLRLPLEYRAPPRLDYPGCLILPEQRCFNFQTTKNRNRSNRKGFGASQTELYGPDRPPIAWRQRGLG